MPSDPPPITAGDEPYQSPPLTTAERAAIERAEADFKAGRYRTHEEVSRWLRQRAAEIVDRACRK